ncbi:hypothetical protein LMH73_010210 [Vibrio splendidus]|nr:hypothetical protein [Vibrio splendidus]MCC4882956.1 hypothetical protein [Vibrio splendidus]
MRLKNFVQDFNNFELLDKENQVEMVRISFQELEIATINQVYAHLRKTAGIHPQGVVEDVVMSMVNNRELMLIEGKGFTCIKK